MINEKLEFKLEKNITTAAMYWIASMTPIAAIGIIATPLQVR
jgi:hypothetical protein